MKRGRSRTLCRFSNYGISLSPINDHLRGSPKPSNKSWGFLYERLYGAQQRGEDDRPRRIPMQYLTFDRLLEIHNGNH